MTFIHWRNRGGTQLSTLSAVLGTLGYELKIVKKKRKSCVQKEPVPFKTLKIDEVLSEIFDKEVRDAGR